MDDSSVFVEEMSNEESKFYEDAEAYWSEVEPTVNGMMGGFGAISQVDIKGSEMFLRGILSMRNRPGQGRALDCGAGIGRVTRSLLSKFFNAVDLVEQNLKFIRAGKTYLSFEKNIGNFYHVGLQNFVPRKNFYDMIWCQWVLGHLTDKDLVTFLINCSKALKENGVIIVKENLSPGKAIPDLDDSSITRTEKGYMEIFEKAGLDIVRHCKQQRFPKQLFLVKMFALKPYKRQQPGSGSSANKS